MTESIVQQFLRRVAGRQRVVFLSRRLRFFVLIAIGAYAFALLLSRLLGVIPAWFTPLTLIAIPVAALLVAWIFHHRPNIKEAAALADRRMATHDLFLTASLISGSAGEYQELVLRNAEERAREGVPKKIVPYNWHRDLFRIGAALALLVAAVFLLPQLDPFGIHKQQRQVAEQRDRVREIAKATELRAALLEQKRAGEQTDAVKEAVANLEKTFKDAKPNQKEVTLAKLNEQQKSLGQLWKQMSEEKIKNGMSVPPASQNFGLADPTKTEQLRNDLQKGDLSSTKKELEEIKRKVEELTATTDPVAREKLRQELMNSLQSLKDTLDQQLNSQALDADLQRALEQLAMSNSPQLSGEALKGMSDSLKLTQDELNQLAKSMADMKNLEEALKALQMAKMAHGISPLDGDDFAKLGDLQAYAAFCEGRCKAHGMGGMGMGEGEGYGPRPHGDEASKTDFHPEKSASPLQPGRMLMEWKTREVSEAGPAREEYLRAVQDVRQQASEAIIQEQIPPGYQTAIKQYFDTLHNDATPTTKP